MFMYVTVLKRKHYPPIQDSKKHYKITAEIKGSPYQNVYVKQWLLRTIEPGYYVLHQVNQV